MTGKRDHAHALSGDASIKSAAEITAGLREVLQQHDHIHVDTQALTAADITTVQSLLSARRSAQTQGKSLLLDAPLGEPLRQVLHHAGFLSSSQPERDFWVPAPDQP